MGSHYKIRTEKTGHYFAHGTPISTTKYVWICLHGYGSLAKYFIQKFEFLEVKEHYVIAPEALSRFYSEGLNDRPAASWMTREDRLDEIADYVLFLETLRSRLNWDRNPNVKIIYLGFSQGVSTLIRWLADSHPRVDYLLLWAGGLPDEILYEPHQSYFQKINAHYFIGEKDPFIDTTRIKEIKLLLEDAKIMAKVHAFDGDHRVDEEVLKKWVGDYLE